jgi:hypothetical protein
MLLPLSHGGIWVRWGGEVFLSADGGFGLMPSAWLVWFGLVWFGLVWFGLVCLCLRWHPRFVSVLQASPLCGAAPTFLCRRKEK